MAIRARWVALVLLFIPVVQSLFRRLDPLDLFCGKDDCYEVLNVTRNTTKDDIRQSYRTLSRSNHPDKGGDARRFAKIATAYNVFMNDTLREEYDYYVLDYPDAYSTKYGHRMLYTYTDQSNPIVVLVGLLVFASIIVVAIQHNGHTNAVIFICMAAEKNLPPQKGGWPVSALIRKMAEERIKQRSLVTEDEQRSKGSQSNRKGKKKKKSTATTDELLSEIRKCAEEVELVGEFAAVNWRHIPILQCYKWPFQIWKEDSEFWTCREIGREIWDTISVEMQKEAISRQVWADQGAMDTWKKQVGLVGNGIIRMKPQDKRKID